MAFGFAAGSDDRFFISAMLFLLFGLMVSHLGVLTGAQSIGVCYGRNGNNLPSENEVVGLYKLNGIQKMRIYEPHPPMFKALKGSNIELTLDVPKSNLQDLYDVSKANAWVQENIICHSSDVKFRHIVVGNEIHYSDAEAQYVLPAMQNIHKALADAYLQDQIKVSTAISNSLLNNCSRPSEGAFHDDARSYIKPIIQYLAKTGTPLLANVYPYQSYADNPVKVNLDYALFASPYALVKDGDLEYKNLFDTMVDTLYCALEKEGAPNVPIVVSESGWSSASTLANAGSYYLNLVNHIRQSTGTPKKPGQPVETFLYTMFDENLKEGDDQHFGLFMPDQRPKYKLLFNCKCDQN